jgi:hypothetical protein
MKPILSLLLAALSCAAQQSFFAPLQSTSNGETLSISVKAPSAYVPWVWVILDRSLNPIFDSSSCQFYLTNSPSGAKWLWVLTNSGWDQRALGAPVKLQATAGCTVDVEHVTVTEANGVTTLNLPLTYIPGAPQKVFVAAENLADRTQHYRRLREECTPAENSSPFYFWCGIQP